MTMYAPTDFQSITVAGGCGEPHQKADDLPAGERYSMNCPACEAVLTKERLGWAPTPEGVALTPDEIGEVERAEDAAKRATNRTWSDPANLAEMFAGVVKGASAAGEGKSLLAQIADLNPDERAALRAMLNATDAPTEPAAAALRPLKTVAPRKATGSR